MRASARRLSIAGLFVAIAAVLLLFDARREPVGRVAAGSNVADHAIQARQPPARDAAAGEGHAQARAAEGTPDASAEDPEEADPPAISGRVVFLGGRPVAAHAADVDVVPLDSTVGADEIEVEREAEPEGLRYACRRVPFGIFDVRLRLREDPIASKRVHYAGAQVRCDFEIPAWPADECVVTRVEGPDGTLLDDYLVLVDFESDVCGASGQAVAVRRDDGSVAIWRGGFRRLAARFPGRVVVTIAAPGLGLRWFDMNAATPHEMPVRFEPPVAVEVVVRGARARSPLRVSLARPRGDRNFSGAGSPRQVDEKGVVRLHPIQPGAWDVSLLTMPDAGVWELARQVVHAGSGGARLVFDAPPLHRLEVVASTPPRRGDRVRLLWENPRPFWASAERGADGAAVFDGVPTGDYVVEWGDPPRRTRVRVDADTVVRLAP